MKLFQIKNIVNVKFFENFYEDLNDKKVDLKFSDLELVFKDLKNLFKKEVLLLIGENLKNKV